MACGSLTGKTLARITMPGQVKNRVRRNAENGVYTGKRFNMGEIRVRTKPFQNFKK
jgi:hypothetical protein